VGDAVDCGDVPGWEDRCRGRRGAAQAAHGDAVERALQRVKHGAVYLVVNVAVVSITAAAAAASATSVPRAGVGAGVGPNRAGG